MMLIDLLALKKRRLDKAIDDENQARTKLQQTLNLIESKKKELEQYKQWSEVQRDKLYEQLQSIKGGATHKDLGDWNMAVAKVKKGAIARQEEIIQLDSKRQQQIEDLKQCEVAKLHASKSVNKFEELVNITRSQQQADAQFKEDLELEEFSNNKNLW